MDQRTWHRLARKYLVPALPGFWEPVKNHVVRCPTTHLAWYVSVQTTYGGGFYLEAFIQPLYHEATVLSGDLGRRLAAEGHGSGTHYNNEHAAQLAANPDLFMPSLVDLVTAKGLPFLTEYGSDLRSYVRLHETFAASRHGGVGTVHTETEAAEAHLLLGDVEAARRSYRNVLFVASEHAANMPDWMADRARAAEAQLDLDDEDLLAFVTTLRDTEERMRERWSLPPAERPDPDTG